MHNDMTTLDIIQQWDPDRRAVLFIDGANLYAVCRAMRVTIDYRRMLSFFGTYCDLVQALYYTAIKEDEDTNVHKLVSWLDYNGYNVVQKPARTFTDDEGNERTKGNMDMEMAVDMMQMATCRNPMEHAILVSGDGDFAYVIEALQKQGVRVSVLSTMATRPPMVANLLRKRANHFLELSEIIKQINKSD